MDAKFIDDNIEFVKSQFDHNAEGIKRFARKGFDKFVKAMKRENKLMTISIAMHRETNGMTSLAYTTDMKGLVSLIAKTSLGF